MDWPQYTTMEHLLAAKAGKYGTLSLVVRQSAADVSRTQVNMASLGLAPVERTGVAAIVHEFEGHIHAYYTTAEHPYDLGFSSRVPGEGRPIARTLELKESHAERWNESMLSVVKRMDAGTALWTPLRTSSAFAADMWEDVFGEVFEHRVCAISSNDNLARSMLEHGHRELAYLRSEREVIELEISERIEDLLQGHDEEERLIARGRSL